MVVKVKEISLLKRHTKLISGLVWCWATYRERRCRTWL